MTPKEVDKLLKEYRTHLGRCKHLEVLIPVLEAEIERMKKNLVEETVSLKGALPDGIPHVTSLSNPTQALGILIASGFQPEHLVARESELKAAREEYSVKLLCINFVNAWLQGLSSRERWVIEKHVIDSLTWNEVIIEYEYTFRESRTKRSLQITKKLAMKKIYDYAL